MKGGAMKKLHPIRKITKRLDNAYWWHRNGEPTGEPEKIIARSVKPLLDELEDDHTICRDMKDDKRCPICRLLAAWKEPL